jgi:hypothetical protein
MTAKWIECGDGFIEADVVRWKEGIWERRSRRKNAKAVNVGERLVTAEVLREEEGGWIVLLIRACELVGEKPGSRPTLLRKGEEVRRRRTTLVRGKAERLPWSDETARGALMSKFLGKR